MIYRSLLHYNEVVKGWCLPFPGADRSVVKRSQYYFYHEEKKRPTQMAAYFKTPSLAVSLIIMVMAAILGVLAQFKIGRYLLEKVIFHAWNNIEKCHRLKNT